MLNSNIAQIKRVFNAQLQSIFSLPRFYGEKIETPNYRDTAKDITGEHKSKSNEHIMKRRRRRFVKGCGEEDCRHVHVPSENQEKSNNDWAKK